MKIHSKIILLLFILAGIFQSIIADAAGIRAGIAKENITSPSAGLVNDSLYVKALALENGPVKAVIITVDAVAIGTIGSISNEYMGNVRSRLKAELGIEPTNVMINASHLHGAGYQVSPNIADLTFLAVKKAFQKMVPVNVSVGKGKEDRITENRRLRLKNGKEWTIRHANPLPPDSEVVGAGPVDPEIGILRLDKRNGETLAVLYNFAGHPYQGVPNRGVTADFPGFASKAIEQYAGKGSMAFFIQGFAGDITPILYKDTDHPRDAEILGNMLGLSAVNAMKNAKQSRSNELKVISEIVKFPKRTDFPEKIKNLEREQEELLSSMKGMSLNFESFIPLYIKYNLFDEYPSYYSHRYLWEKSLERRDMDNLDAENKRNMEKYLRNIYAMEKLVRIQYNLGLLKERQAENEKISGSTIDLEIQVIRIGDFVMATFPAEPFAQVGLNIKKMSPFEFTFTAGYSNGYIHYAPTSEQFNGDAYEDYSCLMSPEWQKIYENKVIGMLNKL